MSVSREYVAASINNYPHSLDWGHRFIAYATCNAIGIHDTQVTVVMQLFLMTVHLTTVL
jgi:hypothetical protein